MPPNVQMSTFAAPQALPEQRFDLKCLLSARQQAFLEQMREGRQGGRLLAHQYPPSDRIEVHVAGRTTQRARRDLVRGAKPMPPPRTSSLATIRSEASASSPSQRVDLADRAACGELKPKTRRAPEPPLDALPATRWHVPPSPMRDLPPKPSWAQGFKRRCAGLIPGPLRDACRALRDCVHGPMSWLGRLWRRSQA